MHRFGRRCYGYSDGSNANRSYRAEGRVLRVGMVGVNYHTYPGVMGTQRRLIPCLFPLP